MFKNGTNVVSFSGIDGAGKSTQIELLQRHLLDLRLNSRLITFWDNVAALRRLREFISLKAFKGDAGVGSPHKPISRRDKNVTSWYLTASRLVFYLIDALNLQLVLKRISREGSLDYIIFDRYIYDELANLPLSSWPVRMYARLLLRVVPRPDVAYLLDADPKAARVRKPEYPLDFLHQNRNAYVSLSRLVGGMRIIPPLPLEEAAARIQGALSGNSPRNESRLIARNLPCSAGTGHANFPNS
jgi:thymidylate kinase